MSVMRFVPVLSILPLAIGLAGAAHQDLPIVHVATGTLAGRLEGSTSVFEGIPFAAPPVGNLRWREPQPAASWPGIRDASHPGNVCMQSPMGVDGFLAPLAAAYGMPFPMETLKPSEDCLYLNVFSPWPSERKGFR